jgi:hypothetical protein
MIIEKNKTKETVFGRIVLIFSIQIINYLAYSFVIPLVLFYTAIITLIFALILILNDTSIPNLLVILFKTFNVPDAIHINEGDILKIYGFLSLIFYVIGILIEKLFKIKLSLTIWKKFKIIIFINILSSLLFFFITYFGMKFPIRDCLLDFLMFLLFGIMAAIFAFLGYAISLVANLIQKSV